jgi:purine nucleosidase
VPSPTSIPVVIDTDPGIDDLLEILLALKSPELDVRGITVTYGNTLVENAHRNAVAILRHAGRRVTVGVSARQPLTRPLAVARETHNDSGLGYASVPAAGTVLDFVKPLEAVLAEQPEPVVLVTLGPLTGLAVALRREPELVRSKVRRHIAMAGNLKAAGNTTKYSEFNAWCDPEALDHVLAAQLPTELVGLDVTREIVVTGAEVRRLADADDQQAAWLHDALRFYVEFHKEYEDRDGCVVNDVLAIAVLLEPSVVTFRPVKLTVGLDDGDHRGRTEESKDGYEASMAESVHAKPVRALLFERVLPWLNAMAGARS